MPGQKFILKVYYKIPLDEVDRTIIIRDKFNERVLHEFTEKEYLEFLYDQGRCNIRYIDDKPRNELVLVVGRRGTKCNLFSSEIFTTRGILTYKELLDRLTLKEKIGIYTYDPITWKKYITYDIQAEDNGIKDSIRLTTKYGRTDEVTTNHPYYVWRDDWDKPQWVESSDLKIGDKLAISKVLELFGKESIGESKAKILGYLLGDGGITSGVKFTNEDLVLVNDFQKSLDFSFPNHTVKPITGAKYGYVVVSDDKRVIAGKNKVLNWLRNIQEYGKKAIHKRIPDCIKKAPRNEIALFLNRLYACNGFISIDKPRKQHLSPKTSISITLASKLFILDIQKELLKFGIISNWNYAVVKLDEKKFDSWRLNISQKDSIIKFADEINIFQKEDKVVKAKQFSLDKIDQNNPLDLLPKGAWNRILKIKHENKLSNAFILGKWGVGRNEILRTDYKLSKIKAKVYAENIKDDLLLNLANSEVCWDTVDSLEKIGKQPTVALEVMGTNIIGNDIISHNSTLSSFIAAYETYKLLKTVHPQKHYKLLPDSEIHLTMLATSEDQANLLFHQVLGYFAQSTFFHRYLSRPTNDRVLIRSRRDLDKYGEDGKASIVVKSAPCSARGVRGASNMLAIMDEQAHFVDGAGTSNKSDKAVYDALTPSIAQFGSDGKIINISSPLNKSGILWDLYNQALEGSENLLMIQAPSWEINGTLSPSYLKGRYNMDPIVYDCEFGGNFSERIKAWMPEDYLRRVIVPDLIKKDKGKVRIPHFVGLDVGFKGDGTALAICHVEAEEQENGEFIDKIELDYVESRAAGVAPYEHLDILDFELVSEWIKEVCTKFYVVKGLLDQHNGQLVCQNLAKKGMGQFDLIYHTRQFNSRIYQNFMMLCIDKKLRLYKEDLETYEDPDYIEEILKLQVKQYSKNVISVEAPQLKGHHDDESDAIMRAVWLASQAIADGLVTGRKGISNGRRASHIADTNQYQRMKRRATGNHDTGRNPRAVNRSRYGR